MWRAGSTPRAAATISTSPCTACACARRFYGLQQRPQTRGRCCSMSRPQTCIPSCRRTRTRSRRSPRHWLITCGEQVMSQCRGLRRLRVRVNLHTIMPAYTHTQPAQPTTLAHYLLAAVEFLGRDMQRLRAAFATVNRNPLGACAITTTGFPIDRDYTARMLGFEGLQLNSYGAIGAIDYLTET